MCLSKWSKPDNTQYKGKATLKPDKHVKENKLTEKYIKKLARKRSWGFNRGHRERTIENGAEKERMTQPTALKVEAEMT